MEWPLSYKWKHLTMKHFLQLFTLLGFMTASSQTVNLVLDTLQFADTKYYEGQKIMLGSGSHSTKDFTHIKTGKHIDSLIPLPAAYANETLKVEMVFKNDFGFVIVASPENAARQQFILIRVEHALSSRELMKPKEMPKASYASISVP